MTNSLRNARIGNLILKREFLYIYPLQVKRMSSYLCNRMKIDAIYLRIQTMKGKSLKKYFQSPASFTLYEGSMLKTSNIDIVQRKIVLIAFYRRFQTLMAEISASPDH